MYCHLQQNIQNIWIAQHKIMNSHTVTLILYKTYTNFGIKNTFKTREKRTWLTENWHGIQDCHFSIRQWHSVCSIRCHEHPLTGTHTHTHTLARSLNILWPTCINIYIYKYQRSGEVHTQHHPLPIPTMHALVTGPLKHILKWLHTKELNHRQSIYMNMLPQWTRMQKLSLPNRRFFVLCKFTYPANGRHTKPSAVSYEPNCVL
jgi:hypothetical protein